MVYALVPEMKVDGKSKMGLEPFNSDIRDLIEVEDATPDGGVYMNHGRALSSGRRIKLDHVPKQMKQDSQGVLADYSTPYGLLCVSDKFKNIVEKIEPGVHQFIPFEVVGAGKKHVADMWFMVVCNRLDSVDREQTTLILYRDAMWLPASDVGREHWPMNYDPSKPNKLVFSRAQIGDHHLWFDKHIGFSIVPLASDKLVESLVEAGVTGISFSEREAV